MVLALWDFVAQSTNISATTTLSELEDAYDSYCEKQG